MPINPEGFLSNFWGDISLGGDTSFKGLKTIK